jgi:hypothetical protein
LVGGIPGNCTTIVNIQLLPMPKKKKFDRRIPPCPGDPKDYILVRGKYRYYWRLKRGTLKPALLNEVLTQSAAITSSTNRAAKQMMSLLSVFTRHMELGQATTYVAGAFKRAYLKGRMDFRFMHEVYFQESCDISDFFMGPVFPTIGPGGIKLKIGVGFGNVRPPGKVAVAYRVTGILLYGDPAKDQGIKIETDESDWYSFDTKEAVDCDLSLSKPPKNKPWAVLVYIMCKMRDKVPPGPKYHALWAVKAG